MYLSFGNKHKKGYIMNTKETLLELIDEKINCLTMKDHIFLSQRLCLPYDFEYLSNSVSKTAYDRLELNKDYKGNTFIVITRVYDYHDARIIHYSEFFDREEVQENISELKTKFEDIVYDIDLDTYKDNMSKNLFELIGLITAYNIMTKKN